MARPSDMLNHDARAADVEPVSTERCTFGSFCVEVVRRRLWNGDRLLSLPPKAFDLLVALITAEGKLVEKETLMRLLWPDTFVSEESLTQCVSALRRALGDDAAHPEFIATIPRRGYRFIASVSIAPVPSEHGAAASRPAAESRVLRPDRLHPPLHARPARSRARLQRLSIGAALAGIAAVALLTAVTLGRRSSAPTIPFTPLRFVENAPAGTSLASGGLVSPDGGTLAFLAKHDDSRVTSLWVRTLNSTAPRMLAGTAAATRPFWSPDSHALGFFAEGRLKTIDIESGAVQTLATVGPMPVGGSWSSRGVILFADRRSNIFATAVEGGTPYPATMLERSAQESAHRYPYFLPDGDHFLYYANSANPDRAGTYLSSLSGAPPRRLLDGTSSGTVYAEPGFLLHVSEGRLLANRFDPASGRLTEPPQILAAGVDQPQVINGASISASATGLLAYGGGNPMPRLVWFDRTGRRLSEVDSPAELHNPIMAADGSGLLGSSIEAERRGTWAVDTARGTPNWFIREGISPVPSPDGTQVVFASNRRAGVSDLYVRRSGTTTDTLLLQSGEPKVATDWTADARYIVFTSSNVQTKEDIWVLPLFGDRRPQPFLQTPDNEMQGAVSPDGHWLAYASDESGRWEVYVQKFPDGGLKRTVSTSGGVEPHWRHDGRQLFFLSADQHVMQVDVSAGDGLRFGLVQALFQPPLSTDLPTIYRNQFAVTADGSRFVVDASTGVSTPITVAVNWPALLDTRQASSR